jgi:plastocyanin
MDRRGDAFEETQMHLSRTIILATGLSMTLGAGLARAADPVTLQISIRDHRFQPAELRAPAGVPIEIVVRNEDASAEEFESQALKVEKVIAGGRQIVVRLRPLTAGSYPFIGEYHADSAKGVLVVGGN